MSSRLLAGRRLLVALIVATATIAGMVAIAPTTFPFTSLVVPLMLGSLFLVPGHLRWFVLWVVAMLGVAVLNQAELTPRVLGAAGIQLLLCAIVLGVSLWRIRLGVAGVRSDSMLVDLRDRLLEQGTIPALPAGWHVESALESAGGTSFAGDFLVCVRPTDSDRLELLVVDVSGKGEQASTRALLLAGAFGGLLGAVPPERFLTEANRFLIGQDWEEGFATAVHLSLDVVTGAYEVRTAGHPPALQRSSGSGRWHQLTTSGPVLGYFPDAVFEHMSGAIAPSDTILLYTDGMVEDPRWDLDQGIDRLLGAAERIVHPDVHGAAHRLVETLGAKEDDRAVLVVSRT